MLQQPVGDLIGESKLLKIRMETFSCKGSEYMFNVGENAQSNWELIDNSGPGDIWFHLDGIPSGHVVLRNTDKSGEGAVGNIPRSVIKRGAMLCKKQSKVKKDQNKYGVIYSKIENLAKGEEVGSVVILDNRRSKHIFI